MARTANRRSETTEPLSRADKEPVTRLAGPYGHPFHPILVPLPIGAWVASFVFDLASKWSDNPTIFNHGAFWLIVIGIVGAAAAAVFGLMDLLTTAPRSAARRTGLIHMTLNVVALVLYIILAIAHHRSLDDLDGIPPGIIVLNAVALVLVGVSGWLGGKLSYRYGVRVADEATQARGW